MPADRATKRPAAQELADLKLGGRLDELVKSMRSEDPPVSWRGMAKYFLVEHGVDVTNDQLRRWYGEDEPTEASS